MLDVILSERPRPVITRHDLRTQLDHGLSWTRFYKIWKGMMERCHRGDHISHKYYREKGITVCDRWHDFRLFIEDMAVGYYHGATLDRIDNCQGYYKENCRWATMKQQQRNRTNNALATIDGVTKCLVEWAEDLGCTPNKMQKRANKYGPQKAVEITMSLPRNGCMKKPGRKPTHPAHIIEQVIEMLLQGETQYKIGKYFGISQNYVGQIGIGHTRLEVRPDVPRPIKPRSIRSKSE